MQLSVFDLQAARAVLMLAMGDYLAIRQDYYSVVADSIFEYLTGTGAVTSYKSRIGKGIAEAFFPTAELAWQDGGSELPLDEDAYAWMLAKQNAELGYMGELFARLKLLRDSEPTREEANAEAYLRADLWTKTLDGIYANIKAMAAGNLMLTFGGEDGAESCADCRRLKGKRHKSSWWVANDLVPPSRSFECGGWRCEHYLFTDKGELFSI